MAVDLQERRGENGGYEIVITAVPEKDNYGLLWWWIRTSFEDFQEGAPKVEEYGAHDLEIMGAMLYLLAYKERMGVLAKAERAPLGSELACWFYVLGKVARLVSDYTAERPGKSDTWHDITFYSMMARRIQEVGTWP